MSKNRRIVLKRRPEGWVSEDDFELVEAPEPTPGPTDVVTRNLWLSVDPYMRGRMRERHSYIPGFQLGQVIQGGGIGRVAASHNAAYAVGDVVQGMLGWEDMTLIPEGRGLIKVDPRPVPLSYYLGVLGMPGLTAWYGIREIGRPQPGETVLISAASGAVGQLAGQIAKRAGARVVGSAGRDDKVAWLKGELGFDAAFNYKTAGSPAQALAATCQSGIDVYFDNVGGALLDAVLGTVNPHARIIACGMISQYNLTEPEGVKNLMAIVANRVRMQGFIVSDHFDRLPEFLSEMSRWLKAGQILYREDVAEGLESTPAAFIRMLKGDNFGKQVVRLDGT
jgi:NADPH-dependent curcumin reductase CurA